MRGHSVLIGICLLGAIAGCSGGRAQPKGGRYRIDCEKIAGGKDLVIVRLKLTFAGSRSVRLFDEHDSETARIAPAAQDSLAECEVLLVADLVGLGDKRMVKWLHQIRGSGVTAGGPGIYPTEPGESLDDLLDIRIKAGECAFGSEVEVAVFRGQALRLKVE